MFDRVEKHPDEFTVDPTLDLDPVAFSTATEQALFDAYSQDDIATSQVNVFTKLQYKAKYRSLQFNLKDPSNVSLRRRLLEPDSSLSLEKLVRLTSEELNDKHAELAQKTKEESLKRVFRKEMPKNNDPTFSPPKQRESELKRKPVISDNERKVYDYWNSNPDDKKTSKVILKLSTPNPPNGILIGNPEPVVEEKREYKRRKPIMAEPKKVSSIDELLEKMVPQQKSHSVSENRGSNPNAIPNTALKYNTSSAEVNYGVSPPEVSYSSSHQATAESNNLEVVWSGNIKMPQVISYNATAVQISKPFFPSAKFNTLLPSQFFITGRVKPEVVRDYLITRQTTSPKPIVVLNISPSSIFNHLV